MSQPLLELRREKAPEIQELGPINRGTYESLGLSMLNMSIGRSSAGSRTSDVCLSLSPSLPCLPSNFKAAE